MRKPIGSPTDLDGDGCDEWYVTSVGRYRALADYFAEKWSWPPALGWNPTTLPASAGRPSILVLALDGKSRRPIWLAPHNPNGAGLPLDLGDATRRPLLIEQPPGLTVARAAIPVTPDGRPAPEAGDPRWTRSHSWTVSVLYTIGLRRCVEFVALAILNVVAPLAFLWLAARRRPFTIRLLMAIPLAAALPLCVIQTVEPMIPAQIEGVAA